MLFQQRHIFTLLCMSRYLANSAEISDETPLRAPYNANDSQWPIPDITLEETNESNNTFQITTSTTEDSIGIDEESEENNGSKPEVIDVIQQTIQSESEPEPETPQVPDGDVPDTYSAPDSTPSKPKPPVVTKRTVDVPSEIIPRLDSEQEGENTNSEPEVENSSMPIKGQLLAPVLISLCILLNYSTTISLC